MEASRVTLSGTYRGKTYGEWNELRRKLLYANGMFWGSLFLIDGMVFTYLGGRAIWEVPFCSGALQLEGGILVFFILGITLLVSARKVSDFICTFPPSDGRWRRMCQKHP
jgi:hypothetical protein